MENRVFVDVISWDEALLNSVGSKSYITSFIIRKQTYRETHRGKVEAEIGGIQRQAKGQQRCWEPPEARRGMEGFYRVSLRGNIAMPMP